MVELHEIIKELLYKKGTREPEEDKKDYYDENCMDFWADRDWNLNLGEICLSRWESCDGVKIYYVSIKDTIVYQDYNYDDSPVEILKYEKNYWEHIIRLHHKNPFPPRQLKLFD